MGHREGRHALYALVPTPFRHHLREARQLPRSHRRRPRHHELLRQGAHPGRTRRLQLPVRRPARHVRGPRLYGMGPHQLRVHQGRGAVHPHRVLQLHRRGARQEDPAAAFHERHRRAGQARAGAVRRDRRPRDHHRRRRAGVLPDQREGLREALRPHHDGPHAVRLLPAEGPGA